MSLNKSAFFIPLNLDGVNDQILITESAKPIPSILESSQISAAVI